MLFTDEITFSSSSLINRFLAPFPKDAQEFLGEFKENTTADKIVADLKALHDLKVLVIGDVIVDEYHYVSSMASRPRTASSRRATSVRSGSPEECWPRSTTSPASWTM
jgi:hypothetical protein